jgi:uncharacterized protein (TIGR02996 family)
VIDDLLRRIRDAPDEDEPRLVYADWVEERGDPARAELIRVQLALGDLALGDPRGETLRKRLWALLREHRERWEEELPELPPGLTWGSPRRGFVDSIYAHAAGPLLELQDTLLRAAPLVRLQLVCWPQGASLSGAVLLGPLRELMLLRNEFVLPSTGRDDPMLGEVLAWPELARLTQLEIAELELTTQGALALARAALPSLRKFRWIVHHPAPSVQPLVEAPWLGALATLELERLALTGEALRQLCARLGPGLSRLSLRQADLDDEGCAVLARSGVLSGLKLLDLSRNRIGPDGVRSLLGGLSAGTQLVLDETSLDSAAFEALVASPTFAWTSRFGTGSGEPAVGEAGALQLASSPYARGLISLVLSRQGLTERAVTALFTSPHLRVLRHLQLGHNQLVRLPVCELPSLESLSADHDRLCVLDEFCASSFLPELEHLDLEGNELGPEGIEALISARGLPRLRRLILSGNALDRAGILRILAGDGLDNLRELHLRNCGLRPEDLEQLLDAPRLASLESLWLYQPREVPDLELYQQLQRIAFERGCTVDFFRPAVHEESSCRSRGPRTGTG